MAFFKLKIESGFKTVSSYNYKFGAFPLLGGGLGWGLSRRGLPVFTYSVIGALDAPYNVRFVICFIFLCL